MIEIPYAYLDTLTVQAKRAISLAAHELYPGSALALVESPESVLLSPLAIANHPRPNLFLQAQILRERNELPDMPEDILFLDIETHNAEKRWDMPRGEFVRLVQYAWGDAPVQVSENLDNLLAEMAKARVIVAHNGHSFDFSVLLGDQALDLALENRLFDPYVYAEVVYPCPVNYVHANGTHYRNNTSPAQYRRWYSLDNLAYQFGSARKFGDLQDLARKYNPKGTSTSELDFGLIPVNDPDFLEYARQDIVALRELVRSMLAVRTLNEYDAREQIKAAINAQMTRNGVKIDVPLAQGMIDAANQERERVLSELVERYDFPTQGKMPWRTKAGKQAIEKVLQDSGIDIYSDTWPRTATGNPSLSGDALVNGTEGTVAEPLGAALAQLQGQRPLAAQTLRYTDLRGRVHPDIDNLQRSGRASTTKPAVTTFGSRGDTRDKGYFVPDPGNVMVSLDLSNADARAVAFMSGDENRYKWFEPGADSHEIVGRLMFGDDVYDSDVQKYRTISKACIAEGELVLTNEGLVPIEKVSTRMLLWDGEDWVAHGGLMDQGVREVITYDGLTATPDHVVFTSEGLEIPFGQAAETSQRLARSGDCGDRNSLYDNTEPQNIGTKRRIQVSSSNLQERSRVGVGRLAQSRVGKEPWVFGMFPQRETPLPSMAGETAHRRQNEMREPQQTRVPKLWSKGDQVHLQKRLRRGYVYLRKLFSFGPKYDHRPDRQRRTIWTGEHSDGLTQGQPGKQKDYRSQSLGPEVLALRTQRCDSKIISGEDTGRNNQRCSASSGHSTEKLAGDRGKVRVYDIRDAGPRNRFTVSGRLVHNCNHAAAYGAGAAKLSATAGVNFEVAERFLAVMQDHYPQVIRWQNQVREEGMSGWLTNHWGREMPVEPDRAYTQSPALMGQSSTTEVLYDGLIRLAREHRPYMQYLCFTVHDEILIQAPKESWQDVVNALLTCTEQDINGITFELAHGEPANSWREASH